MLITSIILTFFLTSLLASGILLLLLPNPIHSLIFLVIIFINTSGILIIFNFEFIALLLIIIYVGALAVLFLFILMMIDIRLISNFQTDWFVFLIFSFLLILLIFLPAYHSTFQFLINTTDILILPMELWVKKITEINNCATFGHVLFSYYLFLLLLSGLILLLSLMGAVRLTHIKNKTQTTTDFSQISKTFYISLIK